MRKLLWYVVAATLAQSLTAEPEKKAPSSMHTVETAAKERTVNEKETRPKLVDLKKVTFTDAEDPNNLLPNRLYLRYEPSKRGFFFDVTAPNGKFTDDSRYLKVGSTLPGYFAGGDDNIWYVFDGPKHNPANWTAIANPGKPGHYYLKAFDKGAKYPTYPVVHSNPSDFEARR